jgi:dienelactone hydrolase
VARALIAAIAATVLAGCSTGVRFSNATLLSGDTPRAIDGLLAKPDGAGPFPAVVLLHTCGGVKPHVSGDWPAFLNRLGYVALTVDTFGSRGLGPCGNALHPAEGGRKTAAYREMTRDAFGALDYLVAQPFVDKTRIAVMGFSLGANTINSYLIHQVRPPGAAAFRAAIGVYGRCHDLHRYTGRPDGPALMQIAGELDRHHVHSCLGLSAPIEVHVIPGAHHSWDDPTASGKANPFGDYALYDGAATRASRELVRTFLARHFSR